MIDFRYHLVSLVAVFLALAVGILLGAGPLREELSATLEGQVAELREERSALRAELDDTTRRAADKDELIGQLTSPSVEERLAGTRVAIVLLPGADRNLGQRLEQMIRRADGQVALTAQLRPESEDAETAATRFEVAGELALVLDEPDPRSGGEPTLATVLAAMLAGRDEPGHVGQWRPAERRLSELDLIEVSWSEVDPTEESLPGIPDRRPADLVVVVSGGLSEQDVAEPEGAQRLDHRLDLLAALGAVELPTVLVSEGTDRFLGPDDQAQDPLVAATRADTDIAATVSSVDNAEGPAGLVTVVSASGQALTGQVGHHGLGPDAESVAPEVPPARVPEVVFPGTGPVLPVDPEDEGPAEEGDGADDGTDQP